jgi:dihydroneopterin aldolase
VTNSRDRIRIRGMRFWGKHGAAPAEQEVTQPIDVDVELRVDCEPAAKSDHLADAIDYDRVYAICEAVVTKRSFGLLETLAAACLTELLADARIEEATIHVRKPRLLSGATPEVEMTRAKGG